MAYLGRMFPSSTFPKVCRRRRRGCARRAACRGHRLRARGLPISADRCGGDGWRPQSSAAARGASCAPQRPSGSGAPRRVAVRGARGGARRRRARGCVAAGRHRSCGVGRQGQRATGRHAGGGPWPAPAAELGPNDGLRTLCTGFLTMGGAGEVSGPSDPRRRAYFRANSWPTRLRLRRSLSL